MVIVALFVAGCGHAEPHGVVDGYFRLPGRTAVDLQRGGLNFSTGSHGDGRGRTTRVSVDGEYRVSLPPGAYSVIGALSGHSGGPAPESCAETINVVVKANSTTNVDYVCDATPVTPSEP